MASSHDSTASSGSRFRTTFEVTRVDRQITVDAQVVGDGYLEFARQQFDLVVHGAVTDIVIVNGTTRALDNGRVTLANQGDAFAIRLQTSRGPR